ncbi:hypothetical protein ABZ508_11035 [Streptomyces lavendulocolor]|uniref:Uncharacterized protein n=1 Tax=Streptomyces lavendulocolor TaxID=67316 RepID=A0ABV2W2X8_9ACTN
MSAGVLAAATGCGTAQAIAASAHGFFRIVAPGSVFERFVGAIRKVLAPEITVIRTVINEVAPLPDNHRSGVRYSAATALHALTGASFGAVTHQLLRPGSNVWQTTSLEPEPTKPHPTTGRPSARRKYVRSDRSAGQCSTTTMERDGQQEAQQAQRPPIPRFRADPPSL